MGLIDWIIVIIPLVVVIVIGLQSQKYVKGVSDFLSAGRVAGRYVVAVAGGEACMGLVSLVAMFEAYYQSGLTYSFWSSLGAPLSVIILLTGYCIYRFRETRVMTMGQFFEIRYNRPFRIFAGILQSISGILNYAIFPAIGARFLVYFCGLPLQTHVMGVTIPTVMLVMAIFLSIAVFVVTMGGQITIMVTDCVQGILSYPLYAIVVFYLLMNFSWFRDIVPPMINRPQGKSMLNPFDISNLRDFNLFYILVGIFSMIFNRMAWSGTQGYNSAAANAHEQKMGQVLGSWRGGFSTTMYILLAIVAFAYLNNVRFEQDARKIRTGLAAKTLADVVVGSQYKAVRNEINDYLKTGNLSPDAQARLAKVAEENADAKAKVMARKLKYGLIDEKLEKEAPKQYLTHAEDTDNSQAICDVAADLISSDGVSAKSQSQTFKTIFGQMRVPMTLKYILPVGVTGVFCALCVFLLISTDTTYLHSWGSIIIQDIVLPMRNKPFTPHQQLLFLRLTIACVAVFAFIFSSFFSQVDFILMFFAITGAIWLGGAGPCIVGGLYWKRGTTAGAFSALICGSTLAVLGIILQQTWVEHVVPWLEINGLIGAMGVILETASRPFEPYIQWRMNLEQFPINSQEIFFFSMVFSIILYVVVSLLTCKQPFNMERMLHRGKYNREGEKLVTEKLTLRNAIQKLIGIDSQYTRGDKALAWSVFAYSFGWGFGSFLTAVIWNWISPWPKQWWANWFYLVTVLIAVVVGIVTTVWFTIGGSWDLYRMFKRLAVSDSNVLDDGRVVDNVSADDIELVEKVDHIEIPEAHVKEEILREELADEGDTEDIRKLDEESNDSF